MPNACQRRAKCGQQAAAGARRHRSAKATHRPPGRTAYDVRTLLGRRATALDYWRLVVIATWSPPTTPALFPHDCCTNQI